MTIEDVDGDGLPDVQFYSETPEFEYGIQTASGATIILPDDLAGPGRHSGWSARFYDERVLTVLDDSRTATLHAFVDCEFVTPLRENGDPFRFPLTGLSEVGTGVQCSDNSRERTLQRARASADEDKRYTVDTVVIAVSPDGTQAFNGQPLQVTDLSADDPQVQAAMGSSCGAVPRVQTSGR